MEPRRREEVLNVLLAQCMCEAGLSADPENILYRDGKRNMPDVLVDLQGLRCIVDGKYKDNPDYKAEVEKQVFERLASGVAHVGVGVAYPVELRTARNFTALGDKLMASRVEFFIASEEEQPVWQDGDLDTLFGELRRTHSYLAQDDVVTFCVELLKEGMDGLVSNIMANKAACETLTALMGVYEPSAGEDDEED